MSECPRSVGCFDHATFIFKKKNSSPIQADPIPPPKTVAQTHLLALQNSSVCSCVCLESSYQVTPPKPHNNPVRSGLLLPFSDVETEAQGDGVTSS